MKYEGRLQGRELTPRAARRDVQYDALVRFASAATEAMILNVSNQGFRVVTADALQEGMEVTLEVETREPVRGLIRWSDGDEAGGVFLDAIAL